MHTEFEAKIVKIDKTIIRNKLKELGAKLVFSETKFKRMIFSNSSLKLQNSWIRLRQGAGKTTLTIKKFNESSNIESLEEEEITVQDFNQTHSFLKKVGFVKVNYMENLREEWKINNVIFDIDTWPKIDPLLEIESDSEDSVRMYVEKLGFEYQKAVFGPISVVYEKIYKYNFQDLTNLII
ncbi:CYTH domain-containing protein [Candidatus Dojkabacteria bacterium]|nr:CYTH domain-containing protein [Candidatus Dojkabacteria bacterium]